MSEQLTQEWRNQNLNTCYPLVPNKELSSKIIVDAVFFLNPPVKLLRIERFLNVIVFVITGDIEFWYDLDNNDRGYTYNDFGKIVPGDLTEIGEDFSETYDLEFNRSICFDNRDLSLQGLNGDILVNAQLIQTGNELEISLDETIEFEFDCLQQVNNNRIYGGDWRITGDNCTQIKNQEGQVTVEDICLPPCYECDERLTQGDVKLTVDALEARIAALENP